MRRARRVTMLVLGLCAMALVGAPVLWAHLMPAQQGTVNILGNAAFIALSLPVSAVPFCDDDRDGRLSASELRAHDGALRAELSRRIRVDDTDQPAHLDTLVLMYEPDDRAPAGASVGSPTFLALLRVSFPQAPRVLRLSIDLFGATAREQQFTIKATRGAEIEVAELSPSRRAHIFFGAPLPIIAEFVGVGIRHVLGGADHLLFLLTIIVAATGWGYWVRVLTSFTVAHSITLTLGLMGWVRLPAAVVEPLIALSIVVMAVLNLRERPVPTTQRVAIVFACGLLHGLGFASALAAMGSYGPSRALSILGFNVGLELGQAAFLLAVLTLATAARIATRRLHHGSFAEGWSLARVSSGVAAIVGLWWMVARIVAV